MNEFLAFIINVIIIPWGAVFFLGSSAFLALARTRRRDRHGLIDPAVRGAIGTALCGLVGAAALFALPHLLHGSAVPAPGTSYDAWPATHQIEEVWAWVGTLVTCLWLYALASAFFITGALHLQRRRWRSWRREQSRALPTS